MPKASKAEVAKRVEEILAIRLDGAQRHDILRYAAEKGWDVNERQIENYIHKADNLLIEQQEKNRKRLLGLHRAKRGALFARAVNAGDHGTALRVLDSECKLLGLFPEPGAKELAKLLAQQAKEIAELEAKLVVYQRDEEEGEEERETAGEAEDGHTGHEGDDRPGG